MAEFASSAVISPSAILLTIASERVAASEPAGTSNIIVSDFAFNGGITRSISILIAAGSPALASIINALIMEGSSLIIVALHRDTFASSLGRPLKFPEIPFLKAIVFSLFYQSYQ